MGARNEKVGILAGLGMMVVISCSVALAEVPLPVSPSPPTIKNVSGGYDWIAKMHEIDERAHAHHGKDWIEPADAVLNQQKEIEWDRYLKESMNLPDWVDLGIENRTRFESFDHPIATNTIGRTDPQLVLRTRLRFGLGGNGPVRFLFEGQDSRSYGDDGLGDFNNTTSVNEWDILQLLGALTAENLMGSGLRSDLHFGRMTMDFGRRRFIARNDYRNTSNAFDGFHWQISQGKAWLFRAFLTEPVIRDDVKLDEQNKNSLFWGTHAESAQLPWFNWNVYYYGLNDQQQANVNSHRTYSTFGGRFFKNPKKSELDYELESTYQTGKLGNVDHFAFFQHLDVGYTFNHPWSPRFLLHYDYASGDKNPNDNEDERFDTLFGARRFEYMPTGIVGPFFRTNFQGGGWRIIVNPSRDVVLQLKQRWWWLAQSKDSFGSSGLRDPSGDSGKYLGHDLEFRAQWQISMNMDFDVGYWHWFKGSYFDRLPDSANLPPGGGKDTDYFYVQMRVRL